MTDLSVKDGGSSSFKLQALCACLPTVPPYFAIVRTLYQGTDIF